MATHSSVLAWRIPGTGEPGGLTSMGSHRVGHDWGDLAAAMIYFVTLFLYTVFINSIHNLDTGLESIQMLMPLRINQSFHSIYIYQIIMLYIWK